MRQSTTSGDREGNKPEGHDQFTVADLANENARFFDSRPDADEGLESANEVPGVEAELFPPGESPEFLYGGDAETATDGGDTDDDVPTEPCGECGEPVAIPDATAGPEGQPSHEACVDADDDAETTTEVVDATDAPDTNHEPEVLSPEDIEQASEQLPDERHVDEDPIKWLPGEFVDRIDGSPAINRKGFEVLGHFYNVDVNADLEVAPEDTDHEYARVKATATRGERVVEAYGSAHVDRGDDHFLLLEMADTRARKRALSIATGAGAVAVDELINTPEGQ